METYSKSTPPSLEFQKIYLPSSNHTLLRFYLNIRPISNHCHCRVPQWQVWWYISSTPNWSRSFTSPIKSSKSLGGIVLLESDSYWGGSFTVKCHLLAIKTSKWVSLRVRKESSVKLAPHQVFYVRDGGGFPRHKLSLYGLAVNLEAPFLHSSKRVT